MSEPVIRPYDADRDLHACLRIWREVGWLAKEDAEAARFFAGGRGMVAELNGEAEAFAHTMPGTLRYLREDLPLSAVTGVTTSRVARRMGLAATLLARRLAADAMDGALVSELGMFDQGFYDRLGFGAEGYELRFAFDPARLRAPVTARPPRRLTSEDYPAMHAARLARWRRHGACSLTPPASTELETAGENDFGLGYYDGSEGELTHFVWVNPDNVEVGPYSVHCLCYQQPEQLMELLALLSGLGDQARLISLWEPAGVQLQDLLDRPLRQHSMSHKSAYETHMTAVAYRQARILDLPGCLARTRLACGGIRFNLRITDPISRYLEDACDWRGVGGEYVVALGDPSSAKWGADAGLPTLEASVGAFTRLWLGALPATGLALTDDLRGPRDLLEALDEALRLPRPQPDWDF